MNEMLTEKKARMAALKEEREREKQLKRAERELKREEKEQKS